MSLYIDTSCFLKLLFREPESARIARLVESESRLVVSGLTRVEALVQISARERGGTIARRDGTRVRRGTDALLKTPPFEAAGSPASVLEIAERQIMARGGAGHCRTLDRLHLATMEGLGLRRLLTMDGQQAEAARALGFEVVSPR